MKTELVAKTSNTALEHILGSAVILNWQALACQYNSATVKVEYHIGVDGSVDYLKLWACGREYWSLICDYSPHAGWSDGPRFSNGFHSRPLGRLLQSIIMNQNMFRHNCSPNSSATLEVGTPTPEDTDCATQRVNEAFQRSA
ncbi:MAG TPA: hypothetical protein VGG15_09760 [Terriglobales bacterium]|jgi:hypothetical protein